jgi:uncharacterized integral membrane protein
MTAKGVAYIVAAVVLGVLVAANWTLFATWVELNLLAVRVQAPLIMVILLVAIVISLLHLAVFALSRRAWARERRALTKDLELARTRAEHEEESRIGTLRANLERELAALRVRLDQLLDGQSALLGRPREAPRVPEPRAPLEPELIPPRATR